MAKSNIETASFTKKTKVGKGTLTEYFSIHLYREEYLLFFTRYVVLVKKGNTVLKGGFAKQEFDTLEKAYVRFNSVRKKLLETIK